MDEELVVEGSWAFESGLLQGHRLLEKAEPPSAIMAANDDAAAGVLQAAWERGIGCPAELSVVGFDDVPLARKVNPPLTTVRQPIYDIASKAMFMLVKDLIPGKPSDITLEVPTELVVRHSTARCPAS